MAEKKVDSKSTCHDPYHNANKTIKIEAADSKSQLIMVRLGRQRSANVPPMIANRKIGMNSATEMSDTYTGSLLVKSVTYNSMAKLRTQMPKFSSALEAIMVLIYGFLNNNKLSFPVFRAQPP